VGVSDDGTVGSQVLRGGVVGAGGVGERAELHIRNVHLDSEVGVGVEVVTVRGVENDRGHHLRLGWDLAHSCNSR